MTAATLAGITSDSLEGVPGDPGLVKSMADHYESVAASIRGAATRLRSLEAGSSSSDALDAFLAKAQQVSASLGKAEGRYGETGSALGTYASELTLAQEAAAPALANHRDAVDDLAAAERLVDRYEQLALVATDEVTKQEHLDQAAAQRAKADDARGRVTLYARRLADAHTSVETAANTAIARIDDAIDDGLDDTVWDDLGGAWDAGFAAFQTWMEENDSWISDWLEKFTYIGGALAVLAFIIPGVNVIATAITLIAFAVSMARFAAGTGSLGELVMSGISLVTMGVGGAAVASARAGIKGVAARRAAALVSRGGISRGAAFSWVNRSWSRARPGLGDWTLVRALGDSDVARMLHFMRASRPGAFVDDADEIARIMMRLNVARTVQAIDHLLTARDVTQGVLSEIMSGSPVAGRWRAGEGSGL